MRYVMQCMLKLLCQKRAQRSPSIPPCAELCFTGGCQELKGFSDHIKCHMQSIKSTVSSNEFIGNTAARLAFEDAILSNYYIYEEIYKIPEVADPQHSQSVQGNL